MAGKDWNWCNLVIKFVLFLINTVIWLLGMVLLAIGIYVQVESTFDQLMLGSLLSSPAIIIIILGSLLLILGFCGCLGALLEIFFLLVTYSILLSLIVLLEIGVVVYVFLQQDQAYDSFESLLLDSVERYFDDLNVRDVINLIQQLLQCCGVSAPNDWQRNVYFNCSSPAFQRCSVPFSCCQLEDGEVINLQCGYRTLDSTANRNVDIYQTGCLPAAQNLIRGNLYVVGGVGIGLLVFQIVNIMLASGLAVDVHKEKKLLKAQKKLAKDNEMSKM